MKEETKLKVVSLEAMMSAKDIADFLRVKYHTVVNMVSAGRIPPPDLTIGNRPRWHSETIRNLVKSGAI